MEQEEKTNLLTLIIRMNKNKNRWNVLEAFLLQEHVDKNDHKPLIKCKFYENID